MICSTTLPIVWSPSFGGVTAGVMSEAEAAGATNERTFSPTAARLMPGSSVTAGIRPVSSRDTTSSDWYRSGIRFVRVLDIAGAPQISR